MVSLNTPLQVLSAISWTLFQGICGMTTIYEIDKKYTDKKCSVEFVEHEFRAPSVISCVASTTASSATGYNKNANTCYSMKSGYQPDDCSNSNIGAQLYVKAKKTCPDGWVLLNKSCYRPVEDFHTQKRILEMCKTFSKNAHLVYIQSAEELAQLRAWLDKKYGINREIMKDIWLGAKYNSGLPKWNDGSPVVYSNFKSRTRYGDWGQCIGTSRNLRWYRSRCSDDKNGLCEIDPL